MQSHGSFANQRLMNEKKKGDGGGGVIEIDQLTINDKRLKKYNHKHNSGGEKYIDIDGTVIAQKGADRKDTKEA